MKDGDLDALTELMEVFEATGMSRKMAEFVFGILWELLPEEAKEKILASAEAEGKSNVIDLFTGKPRD